MKHFYKKIASVALFFGTSFGIFAQYSNGLIISNEGNFRSPNAEISYIENGVVTNNIYALANNGEVLGDVLQSIYFYDDKALLVVNNSNKIVVVNRSTFKKIAEISVPQPRYATVANGKIYSTSAHSEIKDGAKINKIEIHDAETFAKVGSYVLDDNLQAEQILTANGKVYAMLSYFGSGNSLVAIDPSDDSYIDYITLGSEDKRRGLQSIIKKDENTIYALWADSEGTAVFSIDTEYDFMEDNINNAEIKDGRKFDIYGDKIYIAAGLNVYALNADLSEPTNTPLFSVPKGLGWGGEFYGFNVIDGNIYQGNANGFQALSELNVYNATGNLLSSYTTTMGINGVYKNIYTDLSTSEVSQAQISIYPNPVSETLFIKNASKASYQIFDTAGKLVKSGIYNNSGISVQSLNKGLYIISVQDNNQKSTHKFIVK